jgi:hypothetical protein
MGTAVEERESVNSVVFAMFALAHGGCAVVRRELRGFRGVKPLHAAAEDTFGDDVKYKIAVGKRGHGLSAVLYADLWSDVMGLCGLLVPNDDSTLFVDIYEFASDARIAFLDHASGTVQTVN